MFLEKIVAHKKEEVAIAKMKVPLQELEQRPRQLSRGSFRKALTSETITLIAEVKKASPSKGLLCPDFDPGDLANTYTKHGVGAISVLTDEQFFQGSLEHLSLVRNTSSLPLLRKDFIIDLYQIQETAASPADAILLIVAILDIYQLKDFLSLAGELGLDCLTEVHNPYELEVALNAEAPIIGVNNRDLKTFNVELSTSMQLKKEIPANILTVSESGIFNRPDAERLKDAGYDGILVGEAIVKAEDRAAKIRELALL